MSDVKNEMPLKDVDDSSPNHLGDNKDMSAYKRRKKSYIVRNPLVILGHFFLMLIVVIIFATSIPLYIGKSIFEGKGIAEREQVILISPGTGIREIALLLEKRGLIRSSDVFVYGVGYHQKTIHLKAGEYLIPAYASMQDIMNILVKGKSIEYTFTVPEGLTVQQVFDRLASNEILIGDLPKILPPEGSLMTDTVRFVRGTTRKEIINRLREGQTKLINAIWATRSPDLPIRSIDEFVILASIVEKETGIAAERSKVAAVFYNRLAKHMRLQSDPTVIYGLFGGKGMPSGRAIYRSDLEKETPYNTYKIYGLPPTAIANPGRDSLKAVAHSPSSDVLYFVADGSGGHVFSRTLEEHNTNVRKWRALKATH
ncbi:endolytic transglycosylase MltG [Bartonella sp. B23]